MNICVFCSAQNVAPIYQDAAREFATLIGKKGHALVWGGSNTGTMKVIADATQSAGGKIMGISVETFKHDARKNADEMIVAPTLTERKKILLEKSDAILVLPGGLGTLDEMTEALELKKQDAHNKPIVFLNTDRFYDGFLTQLARMEKDGFLPREMSNYVNFADTPEDAMRYIEDHA